MEGSMVKNSNINLVTAYFNDYFPDYRIVTESSHGSYWEVRFTKEEIEINISGDIGFSIEVFIDETKYDLWQYDRSVNEAMRTNDKNILYQLNVLKRFLSDTLT